ncbi:MAG: 16S rRNA (cytidine(1402)-2'-O)-methyltransferase [Chitinophagales bacterium]|nr:16S rRNA (cytidine(1402)-2'-O)-methyltransferase [Chitinophagales bacterium]
MPKLILVPTPVGNLEDMTFRAIRVLKSSQLILAEDTRTTGFLCKHFQIETPLMAFHAHNEHKKLPAILDKIAYNEQTALVSDAGTPGISDPGFLLVRACVERNIEVDVLPGATAFVPALVMSGFPTDKFYFEGFLPHQKGRLKRLLFLSSLNCTAILYESPYRVVKLLEQIIEIFGVDTPVSISREISKKFQQTLRGSATELLLHFQKNEPKGEFVVIIGQGH